MMNHRRNKDKIIVESSWRYIIIFFIFLIIFCGFFLYFYFGPSLEDLKTVKPKPTNSEKILNININNTAFYIPEKYTIYPEDRLDGIRGNIYLYSLYPSMEGYSNMKHNEFLFADKNNKRIDIIISANYSNLSDRDKVLKIFFPMLEDTNGEATEIALHRYKFKNNMEQKNNFGYSNKELYMAKDQDENIFAFICDTGNIDEVYRADCYRDYNINEKITIRYSFSKILLPEWVEISTNVEALITKFMEEK